ncbi:hypothetical protein SBV1_940015 [Verrucomicrobia bacterium]|nr:hypothetical protein SBV1_940015 [Verrucomicrobiota bacterium]
MSGYAEAANLAKRMECEQLAAAFESQARPKALPSCRVPNASRGSSESGNSRQP